jgi:4-diphosphocytidyl-2C-methyl-D-erythritol kinase
MKDIEILFENNEVVAVNKPAGLVVHGDGKTNEPTLVDWILEKYPEIKNLKEILYDQWAIYAAMSGSGSTVFGIFEKDTIIPQLGNKNYFEKIVS